MARVIILESKTLHVSLVVQGCQRLPSRSKLNPSTHMDQQNLQIWHDPTSLPSSTVPYSPCCSYTSLSVFPPTHFYTPSSGPLPRTFSHGFLLYSLQVSWQVWEFSQGPIPPWASKPLYSVLPYSTALIAPSCIDFFIFLCFSPHRPDTTGYKLHEGRNIVCFVPWKSFCESSTWCIVGAQET